MRQEKQLMTCTKKPFATEREALTFEAEIRAKHNNARQYAYKCPECPSTYHLSALPPDAYELSKVNTSSHAIAEAARLQPARRSKMNRIEVEQFRKKVGEYLAAGMSLRQIAEKTGRSYPTAAFHAMKLRGHKPAASSNGCTVKGLEAQEQSLLEQIQGVQRKKQALIDAMQLRVQLTASGKAVSMQKEGEHMILKLDDAYELVEKLEALLLTSNDGA